MQKNTELLLPVGNMSMALAAIHNGADAIYIGMPEFNARGRTHDHSWEELAEIIDLCHLYGVKVNIAFNILIFQNELPKATKSLKKLLKLGPDAIIVQDLGLAKIIKEMAPEQIIHGSTQMTVTNHEAIELLNDLDIKRFVLGRENSLDEIALIKTNTNKELEVFVHGALCVAYSGQCFTSEALGGRSANRGQCAQSCRFDYQLFVDGTKKNLVDKKYLVSPQDLCGIKEIPKLVELGVDSFKVEGRLKGPEYVSCVASNYRQAIDDQQMQFDSAIEQMAVTYSRGFYSGWLHGVSHQNLVDATFSNKRGALIGTVEAVTRQEVHIKTTTELFPGDGFYFADQHSQVGGKVHEVRKSLNGHKLKFGRELNLKLIRPQQKVYLSARDKLYKELNKSYTQKEKLKRIPLSIEVIAKENQKLILSVNDGQNEIKICSDSKLIVANSKPLTCEHLQNGLAGLSHSAYQLTSFKADLEEGLFLHNKEIKRLKQLMVERLNQVRVKTSPLTIGSVNLPQQCQPKKHKAKLSILLRTIEHVLTLEKLLLKTDSYKDFISMVIIDFEFGKNFIPAIKILKELGLFSVIATTRILKPKEYHNFRLIERAKPDGILIRNLGALNYFQKSSFKLFGDFSLNITNSISFDYLINKGLESICLSYDMNAKQVNNLLQYIDTSKAEITIHQYMPEFHMEHCVFAAFLSQGNSFRDCGKPCEKHLVHLEDMYGNKHEIKADQECRNTMFKAIPQSAATLIPHWKEIGVSNFRFEALQESREDLLKKLTVYLDLISEKLSSQEAFNQMDHLENYGVNTGQLLNKKDYQDRKKQISKA